MNRNPARPKRIMQPCDCGSLYQECNCAWLRAARKPLRLGYVYIPLMTLTVSMVILGLNYLFGG